MDFTGKRTGFLVVLLLAYVPIVHYGLNTKISIQDEHINFLMSKAISEGKTPYRDFFSAQMPLMLYAVSVVYSIFGVSIPAGKVIPLTSSFAVLCMTYLLGERQKRGAGAIACLVLVTLSVHFHIYSHAFFGIFYALSIALTAFYLKLRRRDFLAGFLITASVLVRANVLPLFLLFLLPKPGRKFIMGVTAALPIFLMLAFTPNFLEDAVHYHMLKEPLSFPGKLSEAVKFLGIEAPVVLVFVFGLFSLASFSERNLKISIRFRGEDREAFVIALGAILLAASFLTMSRPYHYYLTFCLPFMAIVGARGVVSLLKDRRKYVAAALIIIYLAMASYAQDDIRKTYESFAPEGFVKLIEYVRDNAGPNETILFIGGEGGSYVALKAQRSIAGDFIDSSFQRLYVLGDKADEKLGKALVEKPSLVVVDLSLVSELEDENISLPKTWNTLRGEYYPSFHVFGSFYPDLMVVWKRKTVTGEVARLPESGKKEDKYYLSVFYTTVNGKPVQNEWVMNATVNGSRVFVPPVLLGKNMFGEQMIPRDLLSCPLAVGAYCLLEDGNLTSEVWTSSVGDGVAGLSVLSRKSGRIFSYAYVTYDYMSEHDVELRVYTRLSVPQSSLYYLTYKQVYLPYDKYEEVRNLIAEKENGGLSLSQYLEGKRRILAS